MSANRKPRPGSGKGRNPSGRSKPRSGPSRTGQRRGRSGQSSRPGPGTTRYSNRGGRSRGLGGDQVEGRHAVRELLLAGRRTVHEVFMADDLDKAPIIDDITELATEVGVPIRMVGRSRLGSEAATTSHQGVVARAKPLAEHTVEELVSTPNPFLLVLDGVTDPQNLGALLRTAECAGVTGVIMSKHRSVHITPIVTKTAAGAVEHLPMALVGGIPTALSRLSEADVTTIGLDARGERHLFDLQPADVKAVALVLGDEGRGLSKLVTQRVDSLAAIPLQGQMNSLNVAAASAVACFEVVRVRESSLGNGTTE